MGADEIVTYQLANKGNPDVIMRRLGSDASLSDLVRRSKDALELFKGRVTVTVYERGESRPLTPDEAAELEATLQQVSRSEISVTGAS